MDVDVDAIPRREPGMEPWEVMTSESQERMLAIVTPESLPMVIELCGRWEVAATVIGRVTEPDYDEAGEPVGMLRLHAGGAVVGEVPAASLADEAPLYERPLVEPANRAARAAIDPSASVEDIDIVDALLSLLLDPSPVYRQYDHQLFLNTVIGPGADAALLRLAGPGLPASSRGMSLSTDSNPRWGSLDPRAATAATVAEGVANLACTGAVPEAVVNCLNFGNPEHPEVMWQLSESIDGMADACRALGLPVIGGNVSLYNESGGSDIDPTAVIGTLGLVEHLVERPPSVGWSEGETVLLLGADDAGLLGGSQLAVDYLNNRDGRLFDLDLAEFATTAALVAGMVAEHAAGRPGLLGSVHDVGSGGMAVALAEMAIAGDVGATVSTGVSTAGLFSERPGRFLVTSTDPEAVAAQAEIAGVPCRVLGHTGGDSLVLVGQLDLAVSTLAQRSATALESALDAAG